MDRARFIVIGAGIESSFYEWIKSMLVRLKIPFIETTEKEK